jgi:hypothetical protein
MVIYAMTMEILWNWREYKTTTETWGMTRNLTEWQTLNSISRGTFKWTKKLYFHLLDLTTLNNSIILTSFFLPFLAWPLLPTQCRCRGLLLHLTTLKRTPLSGELFWVWSGATITLYLHNTQHSQKTNIHAPQCDMNLQPKQVSGCRPTPNTMRPKGLASFSHIIVQNYHTGHSDLCWSGT